MGLFDVCQPSGIFAPCQENGLVATLEFFRPTTSINSAGEIVTSFASIGTRTGDLQPLNERLARQFLGILDRPNYEFIVQGNPDLLARDRCVISNALLEIIDLRRFGTIQAELDLRYVR